MIETPFFPKNIYTKKQFPHHALIGVGANLNTPLRTFKRLLLMLCTQKNIRPTQSFPILKNPPFGYAQQPDFFNTLIEITTTLPPLQLLRRLLSLEKRFGRKRSFKNAPRTLDLDIIFFENLIQYNKRLTLPHPGWIVRTSVLVPMTYQRNRLKWKK